MKLKPCPFCGGKGMLVNQGEESYPCMVIMCADCRAETWGADETADAIKAWNIRAKPKRARRAGRRND